MSKNTSGMVIFSKTVSINIMLPEQGDSGDIKEKMEKELHIDAGNLFLPIAYTKEAEGGIDFGSYGRRWCIRVSMDVSKEEGFINRLRHFCKKHNLALNENGVSPFKGRHSVFEKREVID